MRRRIFKHVLHREIFLALWGTGLVTYGVSLITQPPADLRGLHLVVQIMSLHSWAWFWILLGLLSVAGSILRARSLLWDDAGFAAAAVPPLLWSVSYVSGWIPEQNFPRGCTWLVLAGAAFVAASGIEPRNAR